MARRPRLVLPDVPLHLIQRGVDRQACFFSDADRAFYLIRLEALAADHGCAIHAYVLMTNHVHLLLTPARDDGPSRLLQALGRHYVRYVNDTYARTGTLWEGRFRSCLVGEESYLLACYRYIEMNPVRAGMVSRPEAYAWSSHRSNGGCEPSSMIAPHAAYLGLGASPSARLRAYRALFEDHDEAASTAAIRRCTQSNYALRATTHSDRVASKSKSLICSVVAPRRDARVGRERQGSRMEIEKWHTDPDSPSPPILLTAVGDTVSGELETAH